mmetsp:Transcript_58522/g.96587  ORF Transcript_58522/g.96587 Transcript_58522/m.96587 type:complete len:153 (+) Transcript_58522:314-772(+)|eukprot:CAMPEP_0119319442 /NCGR_PEP_ID=MMETSP1333-20130426/49383_1 /TAXON_ID=418940 /ORGANISM="Scyphosphaera apsteinii, Strain RCC1455" /LENGTH=152 /DNA_ID=CAMNT_0007325851 /DNA_START=314 /DNA_END=772 /DNA_ORIENTATION=-
MTKRSRSTRDGCLVWLGPLSGSSPPKLCEITKQSQQKYRGHDNRFGDSTVTPRRPEEARPRYFDLREVTGSRCWYDNVGQNYLTPFVAGVVRVWKSQPIGVVNEQLVLGCEHEGDVELTNAENVWMTCFRRERSWDSHTIPRYPGRLYPKAP